MIKYATRLIIVLNFFICISLNSSLAVTENNKDKKNLSYASSQIKILPLLKLKTNYISKQDTIIFLHPPKAGGTSVLYAIEGFEEIKSHRFSVPRVKGRSPNLITDGWIGGLVNFQAECKDNNICDKYQFTSGHFPYGGHNYLHNKYHYITLIRDPVGREISSLNFDYQRGYVSQQEAKEYLLNVMIDNPQTRMLAGQEYMSGPCNEKTLKVAKHNLKKHFLLAGVTEDTNTFIQVLITLLDLEPVAMGKAQVTGEKIFKEVPADIHNQLLVKHKYDLALYEYVKDKWNEWKAKNILSNLAIKEDKPILTIPSEYATTHKILYMNSLQIKEYNSSHSEESLTKIIQE